MTIHCEVSKVFPGNDSLAILHDFMQLDLSIGDDRDHKVHLDVGYDHVQKPWEMVVCTAAAFGISSNDTFWFGDRSRQPYAVYNLLDQFIIYHTEVLHARLVFNDYQREAWPLIQSYRYNYKNQGNFTNFTRTSNPNLVYRNEWELPELGDIQVYALQTLTESTCIHDNRIRAMYFISEHNVDCFLFTSSTFADKHFTYCKYVIIVVILVESYTWIIPQ